MTSRDPFAVQDQAPRPRPTPRIAAGIAAASARQDVHQLGTVRFDPRPHLTELLVIAAGYVVIPVLNQHFPAHWTQGKAHVGPVHLLFYNHPGTSVAQTSERGVVHREYHVVLRGGSSPGVEEVGGTGILEQLRERRGRADDIVARLQSVPHSGTFSSSPSLGECHAAGIASGGGRRRSESVPPPPDARLSKQSVRSLQNRESLLVASHSHEGEALVPERARFQRDVVLLALFQIELVVIQFPQRLDAVDGAVGRGEYLPEIRAASLDLTSDQERVPPQDDDVGER
mmetsp:Transcript_30130/g.89655  ORF Transcript_30130/g.89655 Transcript_30130/m.89655 type:complete len:286 (-) Transcript_30130:536-1393(-)